VTEARALAREAMTTVPPADVAAAVEEALLALEIDELTGRAGRQSWGYVEPTEAAWEILQEHVDPFLADVSRLIDVGAREAAVATCEGIVLGLYRVRKAKPDGILGWAEGFPTEAAGDVARTLVRASAGKHGAAWKLPEEAVAALPDWAAMLDRAGVLERSYDKPAHEAPTMTDRQGQVRQRDGGVVTPPVGRRAFDRAEQRVELLAITLGER
jgi:hypothetical protein